MKLCINCNHEVIEVANGFLCPDCGLIKETIVIEKEENEN